MDIDINMGDSKMPHFICCDYCGAMIGQGEDYFENLITEDVLHLECICDYMLEHIDDFFRKITAY